MGDGAGVGAGAWVAEGIEVGFGTWVVEDEFGMIVSEDAVVVVSEGFDCVEVIVVPVCVEVWVVVVGSETVWLVDKPVVVWVVWIKVFSEGTKLITSLILVLSVDVYVVVVVVVVVSVLTGYWLFGVTFSETLSDAVLLIPTTQSKY